MYHSHFVLNEEPFGVSPDGRFFFETEQHREALATLHYAILQRRGFAVLAARTGLGKTSVLVQLLQRLDGQAEVAFLPHPYFDRATVLESILTALGLDVTGSAAENHQVFYQHLVKTHKRGKTCVLVFDEAQEMTRDTIEAIRMLSNFESPTEKLVQIVLAGQPRLVEVFAQPECEQIQQRINAVARLKPLTGREVRDYVAHRLTVAGASAKLFTEDALEAIVSASGGVPRNVNTICFQALTLAYASKHRQAGCEEVEEALRDLDLTSIDPPASGDRLSVDRKPASSFRVSVRCKTHWAPLVRVLEQFSS